MAVINKNTLDVQTLERSFTDWIAMEKRNVVETVEDGMQNTILDAMG